jgi:hypothetical protein
MIRAGKASQMTIMVRGSLVAASRRPDSEFEIADIEDTGAVEIVDYSVTTATSTAVSRRETRKFLVRTGGRDFPGIQDGLLTRLTRRIVLETARPIHRRHSEAIHTSRRR